MDKERELLTEIDLWLTEKKVSKKCPECNSENLELLNSFGAIQNAPLQIPVLPNPNSGLTVIILGCLDCGHMRFFSANIMGIVPNFNPVK